MKRVTQGSRGAKLARELTAVALMAVALMAAAPTPAAGDEAIQSESNAIVVADAGAADRAPVSVHVTDGPGGIEVEGRCRIAASRAEAWSVLTDYEGIPRFVSSMKQSRIVERNDDHVLIEQEAVGRMFLFKRHLRVRLHVREEPMARIQFEDVLRKDFEHYEGEWRIENSGHDVELVYRVRARPAFSVPDFVARKMFGRTVRNLLSEVQAEIMRRASVQNAAAGGGSSRVAGDRETPAH